MELEELLCIRRLQEFPGWNKYRQRFRANLNSPPLKRHYIFNIFGDRGAGKTHLLDEFEYIAKECGAFTSKVGKEVEDIPSIIGKINEDLKLAGERNPILDESYRYYLRVKERLINSPKAPKPYIELLGANLVNPSRFRISLEKAERIQDFVEAEDEKNGISETGSFGLSIRSIDQDKENLRERKFIRTGISEISNYIREELEDLDEIRLAENPIDVLTGDFLYGLKNASKKQPMVLLFDDYQTIKNFSEQWLRNIVKREHYGEGLPHNMILVFSGRENIDREKWSSFDSFIFDVNLKKNTAIEVSKILEHKNVYSDEVKDLIIGITGGMPFYLEHLLKKTFSELNTDVPFDEELVLRSFLSRFKKKQRQIILDLAVPRFFDEEYFYQLANLVDQSKDFEWIINLPFISFNSEYASIETMIRQAMIRYRRSIDKKNFDDCHRSARDYYKERLNEVDNRLRQITEAEQNYSRYMSLSKKYLAEFYYHCACLSEVECISEAVKTFLKYFSTSPKLANSILDILSQASRDSDLHGLNILTQSLLGCLNSKEDGENSRVAEILEEISKQETLLNEETQCMAYQISQTFEQQPAQDIDEEFDELIDSPSLAWAERLSIFGCIKSLPEPIFEQLIYSLNPEPGVIPGNAAPMGDRTSALLTWSEGPTGCGTEKLSTVLNKILDENRSTRA